MKRLGFTLKLTGALLLACCTAQAQLDDLWKKAPTAMQSTNLPGMSLIKQRHHCQRPESGVDQEHGCSRHLHRTAQWIFREPGHQDPAAQPTSDRRQGNADDGYGRTARFQMGFQYTPVDSIASFRTPCAVSQAASLLTSAAMVPKRRRWRSFRLDSLIRMQAVRLAL
jgi:hypothetical protein